MISFEPTEEEVIARAMFQDLSSKVLRPAARQIDQTGAIPARLLQDLWQTGVVRSIFDQDETERRSRILPCILLEELGWADASLAVAAGAVMAYAQAIVDFGSADQKSAAKDRFGGDDFRAAAVLVQEPGFDFDIGSFKTRAVTDGSGFHLTGHKSFVPLAAECQDMLVIAASNGKPDAFIVPAGTAGVEIQPPGGTLGLKGVQFADVKFDVTLPGSSRLGGAAGSDIQSLINSARTGIGAILTGIARGVSEHITPYTKDRTAHGSALAKKQSVAFRLADMVIDVPAMRWLCWESADILGKSACADRHARLAQIHCADRAVQIADEGIQLMGGHGYIRDNPVERWYRDARTLSILEGIVGV